MTDLPKNINDRELQKFVICDDEVAVRTTVCNGADPVEVSGAFTTSGLKIAGLMTLVTLDSTSWTPLPATPLANRNAISIQNQDNIEIKYNYDPMTVGYVGAKVASDGERFLEITDNIIVYAKAASGTPTILIEELS